jgi:hypothetical protein
VASSYPLKPSNEQRRLPSASFALRSDQLAELRAAARRRQVSQSQIVREALDLVFAHEPVPLDLEKAAPPPRPESNRVRLPRALRLAATRGSG